MSSPDLASRCRRLAREMIGDPIEAALLRFAQECESVGNTPLAERPAGSSFAGGASMLVEPEYAPCAPAPKSATYELLNVKGTPHGTRVEVPVASYRSASTSEGSPRTATVAGFSWELGCSPWLGWNRAKAA